MKARSDAHRLESVGLASDAAYVDASATYVLEAAMVAVGSRHRLRGETRNDAGDEYVGGKGGKRHSGSQRTDRWDDLYITMRICAPDFRIIFVGN
jgi:hypothetical protein